MFLIFLLVLVVILYLLSSKDGAAELVENKTTLIHKVLTLGNANFSSFINKRDLKKYRLICIIGADKSGRTHLADMIAKKFGHKVLDDKNMGKKIDAPAIRKHFYIADVDEGKNLSAEKERIKKEKENRFVIQGNFTEEDLGRIFKGKGRNRNFLLIFVQPKAGSALKWHKATGEPRKEYDELIKKSDQLLKSLKKYRIYILQNEFND